MKQHEMALAKGNAIRLEMARFRKETRALGTAPSRLRLIEQLEKPNATIARMKLDYFLRCAHRMGPAMSRKLAAKALVDDHRLNRKVGELTLRERARLSWALLSLTQRYQASVPRKTDTGAHAAAESA